MWSTPGGGVWCWNKYTYLYGLPREGEDMVVSRILLSMYSAHGFESGGVAVLSWNHYTVAVNNALTFFVLFDFKFILN